MVLIVPDEFRAEVLASSAQDLDDLLAAGIAFSDRKTDLPTVRRKLVEAGWSPGFSDWYATRIETDGPNIELRVRPRSHYESELDDYNKAFALKSRNTKLGWSLVGCAIVLRVMASAMVETEGTESINPLIAVVLFIAIWALQLVLMFKGLFMILDAKGQSRWWAMIGVFVVFVRDNNRLIPPGKTSNFVREEGAALSDW